MQLKFIFIICFLMLCFFISSAQVGLKALPSTSKEIQKLSAFENSNNYTATSGLDKYYRVLVDSSSTVALTIKQPELGVFCKLDKSFDQKLPFNLRFRLGEYHYTDGLEYGDEIGRRSLPTPKVPSRN